MNLSLKILVYSNTCEKQVWEAQGSPNPWAVEGFILEVLW
jgi:hypothetical protein